VAPTASEEADLRTALTRPEYSVSGTDDALIVSMPQDIVFAAGGTTISGEVEPDLRVIVDHLNRYPESFVQVLGHTDSSGAAADNLALSQAQAEAVRSLLVASGISGARVVANGLGESKPLSSNLTAEGKARNRRIEIAIIPITPPPGTS
jgi:outer membrane protein OmpA-like peptidoglycan-associated protein